MKGVICLDKLELKVLKYIYKFGEKGVNLEIIQKHFKKNNSENIKYIISNFNIGNTVNAVHASGTFHITISPLGCHVIENNKLTQLEKSQKFKRDLLFLILGAILTKLIGTLFK